MGTDLRPALAVAHVVLETDRMDESVAFLRSIGHEVFTIREPAGHRITIFSSHASGEPV